MGSISYGLFKETCHLIEAGHVNVFDYGFSYFIAALNEHQIIQGEHKKILAIAVRASKLKDKDFNKFLKRKG